LTEYVIGAIIKYSMKYIKFKIDQLMLALKRIVVYGSGGVLICLGIIGLLTPLMPGASLILVGLALYCRDESKKEIVENSTILKFLKRKLDL
jgi:hypothetical protein